MAYRGVTDEDRTALESSPGGETIDLRGRLEKVMRRLVGELERRTDTADKLSKLGSDKISGMIKTCRESIMTLAGVEPSGGGTYTVVTKMPFEEEGERDGKAK